MLWLVVLAFVACIIATVALWWAGAWNPPKRRETASDYPVFQSLPHTVHVAHRGGAYVGPQNTIHTLKRSVNEFKVDVIEIDLQLSSDGYVVLMHDPYVLSIESLVIIEVKESDMSGEEHELTEVTLFACCV